MERMRGKYTVEDMEHYAFMSRKENDVPAAIIAFLCDGDKFARDQRLLD